MSASFGHESGSRASGCPLRYRTGRALGITRPGTTSTSYDGRLDASTFPLASRITPRVVGITTRFYVRYALYALPAVAFGTGVAAAWLIRRVRWGWCVVAVLFAYSAITTLLLWYDRIVYAYKGIA